MHEEVAPGHRSTTATQAVDELVARLELRRVAHGFLSWRLAFFSMSSFKRSWRSRSQSALVPPGGLGAGGGTGSGARSGVDPALSSDDPASNACSRSCTSAI